MAPLIRALSIRIPRQCGWRFGPIGTSTTTSSGAAASIAPTLWPRRRGLSSSAVVQQLGGAKSTQPAQGKIGVAAAVAAASGEGAVKPTLWDEFALRDRVALVSGANRGLGLEMALALVEAGARAVYCVDLPKQPGDEWTQVAEYVRRMETVKGRLEYVCADVTDQKAMWKVGEDIGEREGRMDVCVAAAGILKSHTDCLEYPANQFEEVRVPRCAIVMGLKFFLVLLHTGDQGKYKWRVVHCAGCWKTNGAFREWRKHHPDRFDERKHYEQGVLCFVTCCTADKRRRTTRGYLTTRANRPCCRWLEAWRASWARSASGSIHFLPVTFTLREWIPVSGAALDPGDGRLHIGVRGYHGAAVIVGN
jgi:hypothetical protein